MQSRNSAAMPSPTAIPSLDRLYAEHVNPQWVKLLELLQMNVSYDRCSGSELFTADGRRILDFLSGYCVHNAGHNHPAIVEAIKEELDRSGPAMLQSHVPHLAAELAERLAQRAGGKLARVYFTNSGSEGVETAIKFARAHTGRTGMLYAAGGFHGLTCGALSLMSDDFWTEGFGPMLPGTQAAEFGDIAATERHLATRKFAAFILEPIQSEGGIRVPDVAYLRAAQELCRRYGTLLVLDEVQTGMYRTGPFLAAHRFEVEPDMVILAKALSGGLIPVGAVLMTQPISNSVFSSLKRAFVHASTFGENSLSMRAGLATLDVLEHEGLGERGARLGARLRRQLAEALGPYEMVEAVRGLGMLNGIQFRAPKQLRLRVAFESFQRIHPAMFGQVIVMRLFRDKGILTQICGNNFMVLKVAPPLVTTEAQLDEFVAAIRDVVDLIHSSGAFWSDALGLARRAVGI
jgi:ornithine--oxo-acid transaminase